MKRTHRQRGDGDWPQGDAFAEDAFNRDDDDNNDDGVRAPIPQTRQRLIGNPLEVDDGVQDAYAQRVLAALRNRRDFRTRRPWRARARSL